MNFARTAFAILAVGSLWAQNTVRLSGKITDLATGLPVENAIVRLNGNTAYSDGSGYYSFDDAAVGAAQIDMVAAGFVSLRVTNPDDVSIQISADHGEHNFRLTRAAGITGKIVDSAAEKLAERMTAILFHEVFTDGVRRLMSGGAISAVAGDGSFRFIGLEPGRYVVSAGPSPAGDVPVANPKETYVLTFFPGTTRLAEALPVSLQPGETGVANFTVTKQPVFRASGEVDVPGDSGGKGLVQVASTGDGITQNPLVRHLYTGQAPLPGHFIVEGLPPGHYVVQGVAPAPVVGPLSWLEANLAFTITDHDVDGLKVVPHPATAELGVNGSFRMANDGSKLPAGLAVQFSYPEPGGQSDAVPAGPNGAFWLTGVPGEYSVRPVVPVGYAVAEIRYGGGNYLNSLIPMRGDALDSSISIVLTDQPGSVTGSVLDGQGKPVAGRIVLAPDPLPAGFDFRAFRVEKDDDKGVFVFGGLAPGRYKAAVLTGEDRKRDHDLAILGDKLRVADGFEVTAGQSVTVGLHP